MKRPRDTSGDEQAAARPRLAEETTRLGSKGQECASADDLCEPGDEEKAWELDGLSKDLAGTVRDALKLVRRATELGIGVATKTARRGLESTEGTLSAARQASQAKGLARLAQVLRLGEAAVKQAQHVTRGLRVVAREAVAGSFDGADGALGNLGAKSGQTSRLLLGAELAAACASIAAAAGKLDANADLTSTVMQPQQLATAVLRFTLDKKKRPQAQLDGAVERVAALRKPAELQEQEQDASCYGVYMWLSTALYGSAKCWLSGLYKSCPPTGFLAAAAKRWGCTLLVDESGDRNELYIPAYAMFVDDANERIILAIRGTSCIRDVLVDLVCEPSSVNGSELPLLKAGASVLVHTGMWRCALGLAEEVKGRIWEALEQRPRHRLVTTGHSLGAGVANLLCLLWRPELHDRVASVGFGPPAILDGAAARAATDQGIIGIVNGDDMVPRLSLRTATDLALAVRSHASASSAIEAVPGGEAGTTIAASTPELRPAGRLLHLPSTGRSGRARVVDQDEFAAINVCRGMLSHLPRPYLRALGQLK